MLSQCHAEHRTERGLGLLLVSERSEVFPSVASLDLPRDEPPLLLRIPNRS
jgi:hypothetical protein